ncbi:hypothetical protein [Shewanella aestuarii]|uniref:Uncharacterized protein n=1 Tax=Shewanella aestuarii TaxID=1028752 RepID=A0A6G9QPY6_9GAMM|nr:hypothetical protein [Shewanella aestuarii]QIR16654.1 hypothetical protein HBH39_19465 [Shewanella aestuarii]
MNKSIVLIPAIALAAVGFVFKGTLHETYLKMTVNPNLSIDDGAVSFCGVKALPNESADSLISRVNLGTYPADYLRQIDDKANELFSAETPEMAQLIEFKERYGYRSDEELEEGLERFEKLLNYEPEDELYLQFVAEYSAQKEFRANATKSLEEVDAELEVIYSKIYDANKPEFSAFVHQTLSDAACKTSNPLLLDDMPNIVTNWEVTDPEAIKALWSKRNDEILGNEAQYKQSIENFTAKFHQLINDSVAEINEINRKTTFEESQIGLLQWNTVITTASSNLAGSKTLYEVGCDGFFTGNLHIGSFSVHSCFLRKPDTFGGKIPLHKSNLYSEDYRNDKAWRNVIDKTLEKFKS